MPQKGEKAMPGKSRSIATAVRLSLFSVLLPTALFAQDNATLRPVRVVVASIKLQVAADKPQLFRLLSVEISPGKTATFAGTHGFIFVASGKLELATADNVVLSDGEAKYLAAGTQATLRASGTKPVTALHFLLVPPAEIDQKPYGGAAKVAELYRGKDPAPLSSGPHEFSLTKVSSPPNAPAPPLHHRSGAALYRVLSGTGTIHMQGRDEPRAAGAVQYEPNGFIHTWQNTGKVPLVLLQANISAEGAPEIIWLK
jgi:mannose-6-phosphate isomerase-like protein (cupin superfamily)